MFPSISPFIKKSIYFLGLNAILLEKENELAKVRDELASLEPYKVSLGLFMRLLLNGYCVFFHFPL